VDYGFLGVTSAVLYPQLAERIGVDAASGALVQEVESGGPADEAGIKAGEREIDFQGQRDLKVGGDVIVAVDGKKLTRREDLADLISAKSAGDEVELEVIRGGDRRTVKVKLGKRPARPPEN
jgi:S1-C subfamily serine protease